jgi:hypothetical protein
MLVNDKSLFAFVICLIATPLAPPIVSESFGQKETSKSWVVSPTILRDGERAGPGIYLNSGLVITAAHLVPVNANMGVRIAHADLPAKVLKHGSLEDVDASLLSFDEEKLPARITLPTIQLCEAPPWPGDPVIVLSSERITRSHIVSSQLLPYTLRVRYPTLVGDVDRTGESGSGVLDPNHKCLLGVVSQKITAHTARGDKDIAIYFVPAAAIRSFMAAELKVRP